MQFEKIRTLQLMPRSSEHEERAGQVHRYVVNGFVGTGAKQAAGMLHDSCTDFVHQYIKVQSLQHEDASPRYGEMHRLETLLQDTREIADACKSAGVAF
jgi:hypothetical protein